MEDADKNSKSIGSNTVWVRPPPSALKSSLKSKDFWLLFFLTHFFSYFCVLGENADDGIGRGHFAGEIQMCINVACCADVAVTEPLLNLFQAHTIGVEQAGAAMAKVMETDAFHVVRNKEIGKMLGKIIRMKAHSHRVHIDIVEIVHAIIFAADLPIQLLLPFHLFKHLLTGRDKGKRPAARFGFGSISRYIRHDAINLHTDNGMLDADFLVLKVNGIPLQSDNLTPAQAVECGHDDSKLCRVTLNGREELLQFFCTVDLRLELFLTRTFNAVCRIRTNHTNLEGIL